MTANPCREFGRPESARFIVTKDDAGNDRVFARCEDFEAQWTLIPERMFAIEPRNLALAISIAKQFPGSRIAVAPKVLGPRVVTTGAPKYLDLIP